MRLRDAALLVLSFVLYVAAFAAISVGNLWPAIACGVPASLILAWLSRRGRGE